MQTNYGAKTTVKCPTLRYVRSVTRRYSNRLLRNLYSRNIIIDENDSSPEYRYLARRVHNNSRVWALAVRVAMGGTDDDIRFVAYSILII